MNLKGMIEDAVEDVRTLGGLDSCDSVISFISDRERFGRLKAAVKRMQEGMGLFSQEVLVDSNSEYLIGFSAIIIGRMQWYKYGLHVIDVDESLLSGLLLTVPSREARIPPLPWPAFIIRVPTGFIPMSRRGRLEEPLTWATHFPINGFTEKACLVLDVGADEGVANKWILRYRMPEEKFGSPAAFCRSQDVLWKAAAANPSVSPAPVYPDKALTERLAARVALNLCSFIDSIGGMKGRRPANAIMRSANPRKIQITQWNLGKDLRLDPGLIEAAKNHVLGLDPRTEIEGWQTRAGDVIWGSFRKLAVGKGRAERRTFWVMPQLERTGS